MSRALTVKKVITETKISLEYHDTLNSKLWDGWTLKPGIKNKLMEFAKAWADFSKIPFSIIKDVIIIGGNCNYNYTSSSDIDVHLVLDRNKINPDREFVDEYLQGKKQLWTLTHKISVLGYPLEPYAQDSAQEHQRGQGVYSLTKDKWIQKPIKGEYNFKADINLKRKVLFYKKMIDQLIASKASLKAIKDLKKKIGEMRSTGISKGGEFSFENLLFKELRNRGYLDKMSKYEKSLEDKKLSM